MKRGIILLIAFLIVCQLFVYTNGKKSKNKPPVKAKQKDLKEITTDIEKCVKNDKTIDKKEKTEINKCLTGFKKPKSKKDKSTKSTVQKVVKDIIKCLKPKKSKNTKNAIDKKGKLPNKKRPKRAGGEPEKRPPPSGKIDEVIAKVQRCDDDTQNTVGFFLEEKCNL